MSPFLRALLPALTFPACMAVPESRSISGQLDPASFGRTQASAVALHADGSLSAASLDAEGRFVLSLDAGEPVSIGFRDTRSSHGGHFAQLVFGSENQFSSVVLITPGDPVDLGQVRQLVSSAAAGAAPKHGRHAKESCSASAGNSSSFLVSSDTDLLGANSADSDPHAQDGLADRDGDGRPDALDDDADDDGACDDAAGSADDQGQDN